MRTDGELLGRELKKETPDFTRLRLLNDQTIAQLDLLQQTNRRVLQRLTPPGLSELGLIGALQAMTQMWRRSKRDVDLDIKLEGPLDKIDETTRLTVYRIVQEGLTNAFRHSGASTIRAVVIWTPRETEPTDTDRATHGTIEIQISDNGTGHASNSQEGFGLRAMRERVTALAGRFAISPNGGSGTSLHVSLPAKLDIAASRSVAMG